jgi:hypothetical protein
MTVLVGDILQVTAQFEHSYSSAIQNVFHFLVEGYGSSDDEDVLDGLQDYLDPLYAYLSGVGQAAQTFVKADVHTMTFVTDHWELLQTIGSITSLALWGPEGATDVLPVQTALVTNLVTNVPRHQGRKFWGVFGEGQSDADGTPAAAVVTAGANMGLYLSTATALIGGGLTAYCVVLDSNQELYRAFASTVTKNAWYVQRRRRRYYGA